MPPFLVVQDNKGSALDWVCALVHILDPSEEHQATGCKACSRVNRQLDSRVLQLHKKNFLGAEEAQALEAFFSLKSDGFKLAWSDQVAFGNTSFFNKILKLLEESAEENFTVFFCPQPQILPKTILSRAFLLKPSQSSSVRQVEPQILKCISDWVASPFDAPNHLRDRESLKTWLTLAQLNLNLVCREPALFSEHLGRGSLDRSSAITLHFIFDRLRQGLNANVDLNLALDWTGVQFFKLTNGRF